MRGKEILLAILLIWNCFSLQGKELELSDFDTVPKNDLKVQVRVNTTYKGYVVTTNKDTIVGYIKMLSPIYNSIRVQFIREGSQKVEVFKSKELLAYAFRVDNSFAEMDAEKWMEYEKHHVDQPSIAFGTNEVLLYKAQSGAINLYHHFYEDSLNAKEPIKVTFFVKVDGGELIHLTDQNYQLVLGNLMNEDLIIKNTIQGSIYKDIGALTKQFNQKNKKIRAD
jgi:hypothetical protein